MSSPFFYVLHILPALNLLDGENPVIFLNCYFFFHLKALPNTILSLRYHERTSQGGDPPLNLLIYWAICRDHRLGEYGDS